MGLFVLPQSETFEGNVREAIANLDILKEYEYDIRMNYLISFAISCLNEAQKKIDKEKTKGSEDALDNSG